jgi:hypothetical protein
MKDGKLVVAFITGSAGDWGGAGRVLFAALRMMDQDRIETMLLLPCNGPLMPERMAHGAAKFKGEP